jgi:hypothetical protein
MSQMPVAGHVWLVVQYLVGFQRLGYEVFYVEAHGCTPRDLMQSKQDDGWARAAAFIQGILERFDLGQHWAYHALHDGRCFGMTEGRLNELYRSADLIINLHGGTLPRPEHSASGRLVYLETDPVFVPVRVQQNNPETIDLLAAHSAFFTWGLNYGNPDCQVPVSERFVFRRTFPPVVLDFWRSPNPGGESFTTVGNWRQRHNLWYGGQVYHWSKHTEFQKVLDLPGSIGQRFELTLGRYEEADRLLLEKHGWSVRPAAGVSGDLDTYRQYLAGSRGEFTVAKDQNIRFRSGWFSERSAQYLASGRPVITQDTGFGNVLPTGEGLFGFATLDDAVRAVEKVNADYPGHCRAARNLAAAYFNYEVVLRQLLDDVGI